MWAVRSGFQFRMSLGCDEERMILQLDHLHDTSIRGQAGEGHAMLGQDCTIIVVDLIPMAVTFMDQFLAIQFVSFGSLIQHTWEGTKT